MSIDVTRSLGERPLQGLSLLLLYLFLQEDAGQDRVRIHLCLANHSSLTHYPTGTHVELLSTTAVYKRFEPVHTFASEEIAQLFAQVRIVGLVIKPQ